MNEPIILAKLFQLIGPRRLEVPAVGPGLTVPTLGTCHTLGQLRAAYQSPNIAIPRRLRSPNGAIAVFPGSIVISMLRK